MAAADSKAGLSPTDNIRVYYKAAQKLVKIVEEFSEFIHSTVKQPLQPYPVPGGADVVLTKQMPIKSDELEITIAWGEGGKPQPASGDASSSSSGKESAGSSSTALEPAPQVKSGAPHSSYVNLVLCGGLVAGEGRSGCLASVLLDNPTGTNGLSYTALAEQVQSVFGLRGIKLNFYLDPALTQEVKVDAPVSTLAGKTVFVSSPGGSATGKQPSGVRWPVCHYVNVEGKGRKGTLLLENPRGDNLSLSELDAQAAVVMGVPVKKVKLSQSRDKPSPLTEADLHNMAGLHGKTLYVL